MNNYDASGPQLMARQPVRIYRRTNNDVLIQAHFRVGHGGWNAVEYTGPLFDSPASARKFLLRHADKPLDQYVLIETRLNP